jgi:hypothetical protein
VGGEEVVGGEEEMSVGKGMESEAVVDKRAAKRARSLY